ncbi:hypothetical protein IW492_13610 [Enterococcus sp. BWB1-3]|uniref:hypothetical protein n=1 Tax=unclassified Enterococcus TaxID=2608891 RepID=UPI0019218439|nr:MULTISPECIES: hypothetical protein [unclassified Enterococcus]MBL1230268.1 hypothetical protein [Enterococcus sp. BWB1-3]MCB5951089.1 hypothetical protein [Enterococcus sp. BWT-B8]MCB5955097.1 hypothetical protein [Enterococcus sp. CWB-B31]
MLNSYFAFGVPIFLMILYLFFELVRIKTSIHYYIGFILLLISTFMTLFSFQVQQTLWTSNIDTYKLYGYPPEILWLPLIIGILLVILNSGRGIKRIYLFQQSRKHGHPEQK